MGYFHRLVDSWRILFIQGRLQVFGDNKMNKKWANFDSWPFSSQLSHIPGLIFVQKEIHVQQTNEF